MQALSSALPSLKLRRSHCLLVLPADPVHLASVRDQPRGYVSELLSIFKAATASLHCCSMNLVGEGHADKP